MGLTAAFCSRLVSDPEADGKSYATGWFRIQSFPHPPPSLVDPQPAM